MNRLPSDTICASPLVDCSSSRSRPSLVSHRRPVAPVRVGEAVSRGSEPLGRRLLVNSMRALMPSTGGALTRVQDGAVERLGSGLRRAVERSLGDPGSGHHSHQYGDERQQAGEDAVRSLLIVEAVVRADLESSLIESVNFAPSTSTRPPWRSAIARTIASPSPEPSPRAPALARSARRRASASTGESPGPRPRRG